MTSEDDDGFDPELVRSLIQQMEEVSPMDIPSTPIENPDLDILTLYANLAVPESEPVAGWELIINDEDGSICQYEEPNDPRFTMPVLKLTPEAKEWCDTNMKDRYWFHASSRRFRTFYFTSERDYIIFRLRYG